MFDDICSVISKGEQLTLSEIFSDTRKVEILYARQLIAYFSREMKIGSLSFIGKKVGKDHATVVHAIKSINNYIDTDKTKRGQIEKYRERIEHIRMLHIKKEEMEMLITPLKNEISGLESKLINIQIMSKNIIDSINDLYREKENI